MLLKEPQIIWITGLSGAGKTTLANLIANKLNTRNLPTILLDGDDIRKIMGNYNFNNSENHELTKRIDLALSYSKLCFYLNKQGFNVVVATISLYKKVLEWNKENLKNYNEVYLDVPLAELKRRDPKGLYKNYDLGKSKNIAGLDLKIYPPENPRWHYKFVDRIDFNEVSEIILNTLFSPEI